ncbi:MAG: HypC/HybG/HupF family hydrogenase formation chaperone [Chloroflexota bacterium]
MDDQDYMLPDACTLDHDRCVVCADAGIPVQVVAMAGDDALCDDSAGNQATIAVELVGPVRVGECLLTHGGAAIGRIAS